MLIDIASRPLTKALAQNSQAGSWASFDMVTMEPTGDGVFSFGETDNRLYVLPYCVGEDAAFSFRVYGWRPIGSAANELVWIPSFIAEIACVSCDRQGPSDPNTRLILSSENLCDTLSLTDGSLGFEGSINTTGPNSDLIAYAYIEMVGCLKFEFDFLNTDPTSCNLLWGFA